MSRSIAPSWLHPSGPRLGSAFLVGGGMVAGLAAILPGPPDINRSALASVGGIAVTLGAVVWRLPWERWPPRTNLVLLPVALALISAGNVFNGYAPYSYSSYYVVVFVWLGMTRPSGASLIASPLLVVSYLLPLLLLPGDFASDASSLILVVPTCVMVGEVLSRVRIRLLRSEEQLRAYSGELEDANRALVERDGELRSLLLELRRLEAERRSLLDRTVSSLEEERKRISLELHDGPIQHLTALDIGLETARRRIESGDGSAASQSLDRVQRLLRDDIAALRHLMTGLRPPILDEYGLVTALRDLVRSMVEGSDVEPNVNVELPLRLEPAVEIVLYRVAQEALANVVKHARARSVDVTLGVVGGSVHLEVGDDGIGMHPDRPGSLGLDHYGLLGMRQRVEMVGGSFEIASTVDGGTSVRVVVPAVGAAPTLAEDGATRPPERAASAIARSSPSP